jgi:glycolate oxidase
VETLLNGFGQELLNCRVAQDDNQRAGLWLARKKAVGTLGKLRPNKVTMDCVIPRFHIEAVLEKITQISQDYNLLIGNVFHAGDGNLHPIMLFDAKIPGETEKAEAAGAEIAQVCLSYGGSLSGEHGIGVEKRELMGLQFSEEDLNFQLKFKQSFDPDRRLNPSVIFPQRSGCGEARGLVKPN